MSRRVVVTGLGVVSPIGTGTEDYWNSLRSGVCGIGDSTAIWTRDERGEEFHPRVAEVTGFDVIGKSLGTEISRLDRFTQMAVKAADEAVEDSGLDLEQEDPTRIATIIGSGVGGHETQDDVYYKLFRKNKRVHPLSIVRTITSAAPSAITIRYGLRGPAFAISSACASATHAIGVCADLIRAGSADIGLAGAGEAPLTYGCLLAWNAMYIISDSVCRPFSLNRNGLVVGEGAGILILEELEHAVARNADIYAEIIGFGMNADGKDMINPSVEGARDAILAAVRPDRMPAAERIYINAHGTGTRANDPTETQAIRQAFGASADAVAISSTKSMHGHLLGATGAVEAIASILAMKHSFVPPTINLDEPDPECDLDYTANEGTPRDIEMAISNSFAFGGLNAVVAFGRAI